MLATRILIFCFFFFFVSNMKVSGFALAPFLLSQVPGIAQAHLAPSYHEENKLGAVASESAVCSDIGIETLKAGGNAADSLVATTLCVGVIGMYHRCVPGYFSASVVWF